MKKPTIHFAHANGFPAKTYNKLFSYLREDFHIGYLERHGHSPEFPVEDNWITLRDELIHELKKNYDEPIIGMGHSFGGVLNLLAAFKEPELFNALILLEGVIISPLSSFVIGILKSTNLIDKFSPSKATRRRRSTFKSKEEAFDHFKKRKKFSKFDEEALRDFAEYGLVEDAGQFKLFIEPEVEAKIYRTLPNNLPNYRGLLKVPAVYIGGNNSKEARLARLGFMKRHFPIEFEYVKGSHLFPFEKPLETSVKIKEFLSNII